MKITKCILQKAVTEKSRYILITVIDADILGLDFEPAPQIIEVPAQIMSPNVYTGIHPTIQLRFDHLKSRSDLKGYGIAGILTNEKWACVDVGESYLEQILKI